MSEGKKGIKVGFVICMVLAVLVAITTTSCSKVPAGNVGVKFDLYGGDKGVQTEEVGPGKYWLGINEEMYLFPTFTQNYVWTKTPSEGSLNDESITFQTKKGMTVGADVGITYRIDPTKVSVIFEKYRKGIEEITDIYLRNMVRDAFNSVASTRTVDKVYGEGKVELLAAAEQMVRDQVQGQGIIIEKLYFIGSLRLPESVNKALNAKIEATQKAEQRENELQQTNAEAEKVRAKARGEADAVVFKANAEAERINLIGTALRKNPQVLEQMAITSWNGVLPKIMGGDGGIPDLILNSVDIK